MNKTNRDDQGDVTAYDHVRDASVDMNTHWPAFVDKDLFENYSFGLAYFDEGVGDDESIRSVRS